MKTIIENQKANHGRVILGAIILIIGGILLIDQLNLFFIPEWIWSWPMILIAVGIYIGAKSNFHNLSWLILILIGSAFLLDDAVPNLMVSDYIWPVGLIVFGAYILMRRGFHRKL